jgi:hypothetical protein
MRFGIWLFLFAGFQAQAVDCSHELGQVLSSAFGAPRAADEGKRIVDEISRTTREEVRKNGLPVEGYLNAIDSAAKKDPYFKKICDMFEQEKFTFAVDQDADHRLDILKKGVLNQFETQTSGAVFSPEKRNFVEALYRRMDPKAYEKVASDLKPKSMYLYPLPESGIKPATTHYIQSIEGKVVGDTWVLDYAEIKDHTLIVAGDSLDRALIEGDLLDDFKNFTLNESRRFTGEAWVEQLVPMDWIKTTAPYYYEQVKSSGKLRYVDPEVFKKYYKAQVEAHGVYPQWQAAFEETSRPDFDRAFFKKFPELKPYEENLMIRPYGNYTEGLYFGKLPPTKIKTLIYHERPPSAEELKELKRLGIEVIDGRSH